MTGAEIALFFEKWGLELLLSGLGAVLTGMVVHYRNNLLLINRSCH